MPRARLLAAFAFSTIAGAQEWLPLDDCFPFAGNAAFDRSRGRAVLFGPLGSVWELDGARVWHRAQDAGVLQPGPRQGTALVYDEARGRVLLFGGRSALAPLGDTWTWDGVSWQRPFSLLSPPRRNAAALAYDAARQRVVLYGGEDAGIFTDTWEHDGTQWTERFPATVPPPMSSTRLCFDRRRSVTVMVAVDPVTFTMQVFEWNGVDWLQRNPTGPLPPPQFGYGLGYDEVRQRCVLVGGDNSNGLVWEWSGTSWTQTGTVAAFDRHSPCCWFDPSFGLMVAGGATSTDGQRTDLWRWNGTAATLVRGEIAPVQQRFSRTWVWSPADATPFLTAGVVAPGINDQWRWSGLAWQRSSVLGPARWAPAAAADHAAARLLLFGGTDGLQQFGDLLAWNGASWTILPATVSPPPRSAAALAFDEARNVAVLFGGQGATVNLFTDTWEWNGTWTQRTPANSPPGRSGHAMAYDAARARTVLWGGTDGTLTQMGDTWEWNGTTWLHVITPTMPPANFDPSLAYDRGRARIVLLEAQGRFGPFSVDFDQGLWEYDGVDWTEIDRRVAAGVARIAYDERRGRILSYDSLNVREWTATLSSVTQYGTGCGTPLRLATRTRPRIGATDFGLEVLSAPNSAAVFALGATTANVPIAPGCNLLIGSTLASALQFANTSGLAVQPVPLPVAPALRGLTLFAQAGALDPVSSALSLSRGLRVTIGD